MRPPADRTDAALLQLAELLLSARITRDHARVLARGLERRDLGGLQRALCDALQFTDTEWIRDQDIADTAGLLRTGRPMRVLPDGWSSPAELDGPTHEMAWFSGLLATLCDRALPTRRTVWEGLGRGRFVLLHTPAGDRVCLCEITDGPAEPRLELCAQTPAAAQAFMDWAALDRDDADTLEPALETAPWPAHEVWRQDDNGGTFLVSRHTSARKAAQTAQRFEDRGHKQTYWVQTTDSVT